MGFSHMNSTEQKQKAIIIGSGIGGLGLAALLAQDGYDVQMFEKNEQVGGRLGMFEAEGFRFDMGPTRYLMPEVFERFFSLLGERIEDHLILTKLAPSYRIFFKESARVEDYFSDIPRDRQALQKILRPNHGSILASIRAYLSRIFSKNRVHKESDSDLGVFYPRGGIYQIVRVLEALVLNRGVQIKTDTAVHRIRVEQGRATGVLLADGSSVDADLVISNADYAFTEMHLLEENDRSYHAGYWHSRVFAPSAFVLYLGINGKIPSLQHHNRIFAKDWSRTLSGIVNDSRWPFDPSFSICVPSVTDPTVAPPEHENVFVFVPIPPGLEYTPADLAHYEQKILRTMSEVCRISDLQERIVFKRSFSVKDFESRFNAYKGSAFGLAHTFKQTAIFRPENTSKKVKGLYYVGAGTNPGIGMPMCLMSAERTWKDIHRK